MHGRERSCDERLLYTEWLIERLWSLGLVFLALLFEIFDIIRSTLNRSDRQLPLVERTSDSKRETLHAQ